MKKCTYFLTINGKTETLSYPELLQTIALNQEALKSISANDIIYSLGTPDSTIASIKKVASKRKFSYVASEDVSGDTNEVYDNFYNTSDFVDLLADHTAVNRDDYFANMTEQLKTEHPEMTEKQIKDAVKKEMNRWDLIAERSKDIHTITNTFWYKSEEDIRKEFGDRFKDDDEDVLDQLLANLQAFKDNMKVLYGKDASFLSSVKLEDDPLGYGKGLLGTINLVIADSKGQAHIVMFKNSTELSEEWQQIKEDKYNYQLATLRQLLARKGIRVDNMNLNIVPVKLELTDDNKHIKSVQFESIKNQVTSSKVGDLKWNSKNPMSYHARLEKVLPTTIASNAPFKAFKAEETLGKFFPEYALVTKRTISTREEFIKKRVRPSDDNKFAWMFRAGKVTIYIKESTPKEENKELRDAVDEYLEHESEVVGNDISNFADGLQKYLQTKDFEQSFGYMTESSANRAAFVKNVIKKYEHSSEDWEVVDNLSLSQVGIIAVANKRTKVIDFISITYLEPNAKVKLKFDDKTILGAHMRAAKVGSKEILRSTNGNFDLMKIMAVLNEYTELFDNGFSIGTIKTINPSSYEGSEASQKQLTYSFERLAKIADIPNNFKSGKIRFADELETLKQNFLALLPQSTTTQKRGKMSSAYPLLEKVDSVDDHEKLKALIELQKVLSFAFYDTLSNPKKMQNYNTPEVILYFQIQRAIDRLRGDTMQQPEHLSKMDKNIRNPDNVPERNIRRITSIVTSSFADVTNTLTEFAWKWQEEFVKPFHDAKGYTSARNNLIGDQMKLYENMILKTNGKVNPNMLFVNPYDPATPLSDAERTMLKSILFNINKWRMLDLGIQLKDESDTRIPELSEKHKEIWFNIPLNEASTSSKAEMGRLKQWAKRNIDIIKQKGWEGVKDEAKRGLEGVLDKFEEAAVTEDLVNYRMFNRFDRSDKKGEVRDQLLAQHPIEFWEQNLETLVLDYEFAHIRKQIFDKSLLLVKGIQASINLYGANNGVDVEEINNYIDDYIKHSVFNKSLINSDYKGAASILNNIKYFGSMLTLGFNPRGSLRDIMEGMWKYTSRAMTGHGGASFNQSDLLTAGKIMIGDMGNFIHNVTLIEALNTKGRFANVDINRLTEELKTGKSGLMNFESRWMFFFTKAPDYFNRMTMFVAQCIHDGTWDAFSFEKGELKYDWKKDKRFDKINNLNLSKVKFQELSEEQKAQMSEYLNLVKELEVDTEEKIELGSELPFAYPKTKMAAMKTFSDSVFGYYDHDTRMLLERGFLGMMTMQFKTYVSSSVKNWATKPDYYNMGEQAQVIDDATGLPLYWDDETHMPTTEDTGVPYMEYSESFNKGIFYTLRDALLILTNIKEGNLKEDIWNDPLERKNVKQFLNDIIKYLLFGIMGGMLIGAYKSHRKAQQKGRVISAEQIAANTALDIFSSAYLGSLQDLFILNTVQSAVIDIEPASFAIATNFYKAVPSIFDEDRGAVDFLMRQTGVGRTFKEVWQGVRHNQKLTEAQAK